MSSRHIARLRAQRQASAATVSSGEEDSSSEEDQPRTSAFAAFNLSSSEDDSSSEEESASGSEEDSEIEFKKVPTKEQQSVAASLKAKREAEDLAIAEAQEAVEREQIARILQMSRLRSEVRVDDLLQVNMKKVNADFELRRKFGADAVDGEARQERQGRLRQRGVRGRKGKGGILLSSTRAGGGGGVGGAGGSGASGLLVTPLPSWPLPPSRAAGGLGMVVSEGAAETVEQGVVYFSYAPSDAYAAVTAEFHSVAATHDPNRIAQLLQLHPCHAESLLQMSEVYLCTQQYDTAAMLLRRCLHVLQRAWHPLFVPGRSRCRLDAHAPVNRCFFQALARHTQLVGRRGCTQTALDLCRLLLSLNPTSDVTGALLALDYYALRAGDYSFLLRIAPRSPALRAPRSPLLPTTAAAAAAAASGRGGDGDGEGDGEGKGDGSKQQRGMVVCGIRVCLLPSFAFSRGLALFHSATDVGSGGSSGGSSGGAVSSPSDAAGEAVCHALLLYPMALEPLLHRCEEAGAPIGIASAAATARHDWKPLLRRELFSGWQHRRRMPGVCEKLVAIFVERHHTLWKAEETLALLFRAACSAADLADALHPLCVSAAANREALYAEAADSTADCDTQGQGQGQGQAAVAPGAAARSLLQTYAGLELSAFSDSIAIVPQDQLAAMMGGGGGGGQPPPPPPNGIPTGVNILQADAASNPLLLFFQTLMPWNFLPTQDAAAAAAAAAALNGGGAQEMQALAAAAAAAAAGEGGVDMTEEEALLQQMLMMNALEGNAHAPAAAAATDADTAAPDTTAAPATGAAAAAVTGAAATASSGDGASDTTASTSAPDEQKQ